MASSFCPITWRATIWATIRASKLRYMGASTYDSAPLSLSAGDRQNFMAMPYRGISVPSVSGGFWLASKAKLRATVNRAFRLPNYTDLYYHDPANIGNPNLRPEHAMNYEGGLDFIRQSIGAVR